MNTLAERALAALRARGIKPPDRMTPNPRFDDDGWRWLSSYTTGAGWRWQLDLDDDGNKGRLLGVLREASGRQLCVKPDLLSIRVPQRVVWRICGVLSANEFHEINHGHVASGFDSETEALIAALERTVTSKGPVLATP